MKLKEGGMREREEASVRGRNVEKPRKSSDSLARWLAILSLVVSIGAGLAAWGRLSVAKAKYEHEVSAYEESFRTRLLFSPEHLDGKRLVRIRTADNRATLHAWMSATPGALTFAWRSPGLVEVEGLVGRRVNKIIEVYEGAKVALATTADGSQESRENLNKWYCQLYHLLTGEASERSGTKASSDIREVLAMLLTELYPVTQTTLLEFEYLIGDQVKSARHLYWLEFSIESGVPSLQSAEFIRRVESDEEVSLEDKLPGDA